MSVRCWVCMDKGYVFYYQVNNGNRYEYVAYCDRCDSGQEVKYDGRSLPRERNPYYTPSISQILDADEIAVKNKEKYEKAGNAKRPEKLKEMFKEGPW